MSADNPRPPFFIPTEVNLRQDDAELLDRLVTAMTDDPDNWLWHREDRRPDALPLAAYFGVRQRLELALDVAERSDAIRFKIIQDGATAGRWELVDGNPVAYVDKPVSYRTIERAGRRSLWDRLRGR